MHPFHAHLRVSVVSLGPPYDDAAAAWAARLGLPFDQSDGYALQVGPGGLQLVERGPDAAGAVGVDFLSGAVAHRRHFGGGSGQMIAKAAGVQSGVRPTVLDATAGLGRDAFVLAQLGCVVTLVERHPIVVALLQDGLVRALADPQTADIVRRMSLLCGDAIRTMCEWTDVPPQVIYLDPMFPHREKTALVKKEMRLFQALAGDDADAPDLLAAALALASHRVVVKRPRKAPPIAGLPPSYALSGKSSRFDIYPKRALK